MEQVNGRRLQKSHCHVWYRLLSRCYFLVLAEFFTLIFPATNVIDTYVYRALIEQGNISMSSAAGVYQSLVGFVIVMVSNWIVRKVDKDQALF